MKSFVAALAFYAVAFAATAVFTGQIGLNATEAYSTESARPSETSVEHREGW